MPDISRSPARRRPAPLRLALTVVAPLLAGGALLLLLGGPPGGGGGFDGPPATAGMPAASPAADPLAAGPATPSRSGSENPGAETAGRPVAGAPPSGADLAAGRLVAAFDGPPPALDPRADAEQVLLQDLSGAALRQAYPAEAAPPAGASRPPQTPPALSPHQ
ncbi:MAG: hypothetical protein ISR76_00455 [Planctomycetes bacterium]|nr:hypothetical protein [Planctomycetota bacterium]MBL7007442.1 hypothetical protein [Planctomycetota bacterium]